MWNRVHTELGKVRGSASIESVEVEAATTVKPPLYFSALSPECRPSLTGRHRHPHHHKMAEAEL